MSVFKNLKSIFIEESESEENTSPKSEDKTTTNKDKQSTKESNNTSSTSDSVPNIPSEGKKDDKIIDTLFKAIEKSNLNGFDYLEFKQSVKGLEKIVVDEATRYKSAFATASTMGVTMKKLVETAEYYGKVLDKERQQFVKAASEQSNKLVEKRKQEMQYLLKSMAEKQKLIDQMQAELKTSEQKIKQIQTGIDKAAVKIESTKKNFETSFGIIRKQIDSDIEKIRTYLK